jgi:phage-related protein
MAYSGSASVRHEPIEDATDETPAKPVRWVGSSGDDLKKLHAFQKKAKKGKATPQHDIELIKTRLAIAQQHYKANPPPSARPEEK